MLRNSKGVCFAIGYGEDGLPFCDAFVVGVAGTWLRVYGGRGLFTRFLDRWFCQRKGVLRLRSLNSAYETFQDACG